MGVTKPNEKIYLKALEQLRLLPEQTVFIDDNLINCKGAMKLGIKGIFLCRNKLQYCIYKLFCLGKDYEVINNLKQLDELKIVMTDFINLDEYKCMLNDTHEFKTGISHVWKFSPENINK